MQWADVGAWIKQNAGPGAALVGSLLTGNVPAAVAAGVALVTGATGQADADSALSALQSTPETVVRLRELALQNEAAIRMHIETMTRLALEDAQAEHTTTQATIQAGDRAEDVFVRRTRPAQSWCSLFASFAYVFLMPAPSLEILLALLVLPWAYAGLRQIGKGVDSVAGAWKARAPDSQ